MDEDDLYEDEYASAESVDDLAYPEWMMDEIVNPDWGDEEADPSFWDRVRNAMREIHEENIYDEAYQKGLEAAREAHYSDIAKSGYEAGFQDGMQEYSK